MNLDIMKELNIQPHMELVENYRGNWKTMFFECFTQEFHL
jgi:hypothetical protein